MNDRINSERCHVKLFFVFISALLLFCGCGNPETQREKYRDKIRAWQAREAVCVFENRFSETGYVFTGNTPHDIRQILTHYEIQKWEYEGESGDYWETSCEALENLAGDCDALGVAIYRALVTENNPDWDVRMRTLKITSNTGHRIVIVYTESGEFYEVDDSQIRGLESDNVFAEFDEFYIY